MSGRTVFGEHALPQYRVSMAPAPGSRGRSFIVRASSQQDAIDKAQGKFQWRYGYWPPSEWNYTAEKIK